MSKEDVINKIDLNWPKDVIIRYCIVKLAPFFERDEYFFFAPKSVQQRLCDNSLWDIDSKKIVCYSICAYYQKLFASLGIECQLIGVQEPEIVHYILMVYGDVGWYLIDPLRDLMRHQGGFCSAYYGTYLNVNKDDFPFLVELPREYIKKIDDFLGITKNGYYLDDKFIALTGKIKQYFSSDSLMEAKMSLINDWYINQANINGVIERNQYYRFITDFVFDDEERKKMRIKPYVNNRIEWRLEIDDEIIYYVEQRDIFNYATLIKRKK